MSYYLYYCKNCNTLEGDVEDNIMLRCPDCNQRYYPLHVNDEQWENADNEEKRRILQHATMPEMSTRKTVNDVSSNRQQKQGKSSEKNFSKKQDSSGGISGLSIAAFVISFLGCLSFIGLILGIVDLSKKDGKKKNLSIAAIIVSILMFILTLVLVGVGGSSSDKKELTNKSSKSKAKTEAVSETEEEQETSDESFTSSEKEDTTSGFSIDEQVLVEQQGVKITAVEYVYDSIWGDGIKLLLENNTSQNLTFSCEALIVNDFMISDLFVQSVASGKSAYETMYLSNSQLRQAGIDNVGKIEIYFRVYDSDTWDNLFTSDCVTLETSDYANMDTTTDIQGLEIYNKDGITIKAQYVDENSFWGKAILLYAENNSSRNITISAENLSINGFMMLDLYSDTIYAGKKSFNDVTLLSSELEENNITEINDVEISFRIYDPDTYTDIAQTGPISFSTK